MKLILGLVFFFSFTLFIYFSIFFDQPGDQTSTAQLPTNKSLRDNKLGSMGERFGKIPLHFEKNPDLSSDLRFVSRNLNHALFLTSDQAQLVFPKGNNKGNDHLNMKFVGNTNSKPAIKGGANLDGKTNYFIGSDPEKWHVNVPTFESVRYENLYEGVDLVFYGTQDHLEYDFIVSPNIDPNIIDLKFDNADKIEIDKNGDLLLTVGEQMVRQHSPITYQEKNGLIEEIESKYVFRKETSSIGFDFGDYDADFPLVIDPVIVFSTLLGGSAGDSLFNIEAGYGIGFDSAGNIYVAGTTPSGDFPVLNPHQQNSGGNYDAFLTKLNPTGTAIIFSSYFGGSDVDRITSLSIGPANEVFVSGFTYSTNFPTLMPFQSINRGNNDGFIARFKASGTLDYSTYIGGSGGESCNFIKNEGANIVYFAGSTGSTDFPTANALQPANAGNSDFVAGKLDLSTNTLIFSTYFGGSNSESMIFSAGAVDSAGNIYFGGVSNSFDYPTSPNAFQPENNGSDDAVVTKISASGQELVYSTFVGGNLVDSADALAVDMNGNAYITGFTRSANFPSKNAIQTQLNDVDSFVTKLNPTGTGLVFSTLLGGHNLERGSAIAIDPTGNCYVSGRSNSGDFPTKRALRPPRGLDDVFVSKFNRDGALLFSTLIGGSSNDNSFAIAADASNNAFVSGVATRNFFVTPGAFQTTIRGDADAFVAKINTSVRKVKSDFDGDGKSDVAVFRPTTGVWYVYQSTNGMVLTLSFGINGDIPVPGDYDGDGKTDLAIYRPSEAVWFIRNSSNGAVRSAFWGINTDVPVQGDYDGDDKTDIAVYRPSSGVWYIIQSSNNGLRTNTLGAGTDKPVPADYDGDGVTDIAIYRTVAGVWFYVGSSRGVSSQQFGINTDKPTPADYDGDGYDDISVYRPNQGLWYRLQSGSGNSLSVYNWGIAEDVPAAGDYDGDGKEDIAVFRPSTGVWYVTRNSGASFFAAPFGMNGDIPVASAYAP